MYGCMGRWDAQTALKFEPRQHNLKKKIQKDLNNKLPHEAIDSIQNSSWEPG